MPIKKTTASTVFKFIVEDGKIIMGNVAYHKDLVSNEKKVSGGGMFNINKKDELIRFFGSSYKYGWPDVEEVKAAVNNWKVYIQKGKLLGKDYKITIDTQFEGSIKLN